MRLSQTRRCAGSRRRFRHHTGCGAGTYRRRCERTIGITLRRNEFPDAVTVTVAGLPAGVTADPLTIDADTGTLVLHAATGATQGDAVLAVTATTKGRFHEVPLSLLTMGPPGTLDRSFGAGGMVSGSLVGQGDAVVIQQDGKVLIAGFVVTENGANDMVARFLPDGAIDTSFSGGMAILVPTLIARPAVALQPDGKIGRPRRTHRYHLCGRYRRSDSGCGL
jgi:hypothetical protein